MRIVTVSVSQFVRVREAYIGKIIGIFTHVRGKARRLFAVLLLADGVFGHRGIIENTQSPLATAGPILLTPNLKLTKERVIVGLPSIDSQPIWVTPAIEPDTFWSSTDSLSPLFHVGTPFSLSSSRLPCATCALRCSALGSLSAFFPVHSLWWALKSPRRVFSVGA